MSTQLPPAQSGAPYDPSTSAMPPAAPAPPAAVWEDFVDIFTAPAAVFARRAKGSFWVPTLVVAAVVGVVFVANQGVLQPMLDAEFQRGAAAAMRNNPAVTPEMMARMRSFGEKMAMVMAFLGVPIAVFLIAGALWLTGKLFDALQAFHAALVVAAYAYVPKIVESVLMTIQGLVMDPASLDGRYRMSLGPARFLDPDTASPVLLALVGRVDVITIWVTVLLAIGLSVTGKISRPKAAVAAAIVWLLGGLLPLWQAIQAS
ncbi:MAG TPA: YIP1 family protein [Gemmatimonadaceae bacterium]